MTAEQIYLEDLKSKASTSFPPLENSLTWSKTESTAVKAIYWQRNEDNPPQQSWSVDGVLSQCQQDVAKQQPSILLIESIPPELIARLGVAFGVEKECWLSYLCNPVGQCAWQALFPSTGRFNIARIAMQAGWDPDSTRRPKQRESTPTSMDFTGRLGTMSAFAQSHKNYMQTRYPRLEHYDPRYGASMSTNMTWFVLADTICESSSSPADTDANDGLGLFLVDACVGLYRARTQWAEPEWPVLRIPCSDTWDGLSIPPNWGFDTKFSTTFATFAHFLSLLPHRKALMTANSPRRVIDPIALAYYVSASLYRSNLGVLQGQVHDIAFRQLQSDDAYDLERLNRVLHQRREEIVLLQSQVAYGKKSIHPQVRGHLAKLPTESAGDSPLITFDEVQKDSIEFQRFLMETFQLLTSTISIRDAKLSIEQAARATRLTQLAAVYLPLTLVTGIFGMNIREITRDDPSWWACILTLVFVVLLTSTLLWAEAAWKQYRTGIANEVKDWVSRHHCGKCAWKWVHRKWYNLWKR